MLALIDVTTVTDMWLLSFYLQQVWFALYVIGVLLDFERQV